MCELRFTIYHTLKIFVVVDTFINLFLSMMNLYGEPFDNILFNIFLMKKHCPTICKLWCTCEFFCASLYDSKALHICLFVHSLAYLLPHFAYFFIYVNTYPYFAILWIILQTLSYLDILWHNLAYFFIFCYNVS